VHPSCGTFHSDAPCAHLANRVTHDLREVPRLPLCELMDLFAATESVRDDDAADRCLAHGWQQRTFAHSDRHIVVPCVVPEGTGHSTTARVERARFETGGGERHLTGLASHECLLVAVDVGKDLAVESRQLAALEVRLEEGLEQDGLFGERSSKRPIAGKRDVVESPTSEAAVRARGSSRCSSRRCI
jgi:hypothetical protein